MPWRSRGTWLLFLTCALAPLSNAAAADFGTLSLVLSGEAFEGAPEFVVTLGGQQIGTGTVRAAIDTERAGRLTAVDDASRYFQRFTFQVPDALCVRFADLAVAFTNDAWASEDQPGLDRNLFLVSASINGFELPAEDFSLLHSGAPSRIELLHGLFPLFTGDEMAVVQAPPTGWPDAAAATGIDGGNPAACPRTHPLETVAPVYTGILNFDLTVSNPSHGIPGDGGGMALHDAGVLIARPFDGSLWSFDRETRILRRSGLTLPPSNHHKLPATTAGGKPINRNWLRYIDIEIVDRDGQEYLLSSYTFYDDVRNCVVGRLAAAPLPGDWASRLAAAESGLALDWDVVFETSPCIGFFEGNRHPFAGHLAGGRIAKAPDGAIYLTVGDYEHDGVEGKGPIFAQLSDTSYGKVFRIDLDDWHAEAISMGHRNPQGITLDPAGRVWEVEHGPMGGDELNLIRPGTNYGWPYATLGMNDAGVFEADDKSWPYSRRQGRHDGYEMPTFSWVPSIAPSVVKFIRDLDERWDGDLLVGSLAGQSLFRLRFENGAVIGDERVPLGRRIRYLEVGHGRIYLLFDDGEFGFLTPHVMTATAAAPDPATETLARHGCLQCHSAPTAPRLSAVFGSPTAAQPDVAYSQALKSLGGVWDAMTLRAFLGDTDGFAPGTAMPPQGLSPEAIEELVAALAQLRSR